MSSRFCPSILLNFHRLTITDAMFKQFSQNLTIHAHYCLILNKIKHTNNKLCCIGHWEPFEKTILTFGGKRSKIAENLILKRSLGLQSIHSLIKIHNKFEILVTQFFNALLFFHFLPQI